LEIKLRIQRQVKTLSPVIDCAAKIAAHQVSLSVPAVGNIQAASGYAVISGENLNKQLLSLSMSVRSP
jgi:hypothetical protein